MPLTILHLNVSSAQVEEPFPEQPFSTLALLPGESGGHARSALPACLERAPQRGLGLRLYGNPPSLAACPLSQTRCCSRLWPLGLPCLVSHGHWEECEPFLTQNHSAEAESPVCLQRMKICLLGEVRERCSPLKEETLEEFCLLSEQRRPGMPNGPAQGAGPTVQTFVLA